MPFAYIIAVVVLIGVMTTRDEKRRTLPVCRETLLLIALWGVYTLSTAFALYPDEAWPQWWKVSKILIFSVLTLLYFQDRYRLRILFLVVALSIGFYGLKGGIWVFKTGGSGSSAVLGPEGTFLGGNTEIGLALNMILPFLLCLGREEPRRWLRRLMFAAFGFSIVAIMFTYSRGAILGLPPVLMMLFFSGRRKFIGIVGMVILAYFVMLYPPKEWFTRVQSIHDYQDDRSSRMRLESWKVAWHLALDRPLTGAGFWAMDHDAVFGRYLPDYIRAQSAHSIWFQVLADHGFPGLILFSGLIVSSYIAMFRLNSSAKRRRDADWLINYCQMIEASMMAYLVSGSFLSQSYWDLFYELIVFVILLRVVALQSGVLVPLVRREIVQPYWAAHPTPQIQLQ